MSNTQANTIIKRASMPFVQIDLIRGKPAAPSLPSPASGGG
jgi:hypothetical protein